MGTNQRWCLARHPENELPALGFCGVVAIQQVSGVAECNDGLGRKDTTQTL